MSSSSRSLDNRGSGQHNVFRLRLVPDLILFFSHVFTAMHVADCFRSVKLHLASLQRACQSFRLVRRGIFRFVVQTPLPFAVCDSHERNLIRSRSRSFPRAAKMSWIPALDIASPVVETRTQWAKESPRTPAALSFSALVTSAIHYATSSSHNMPDRHEAILHA